MTTPARRLALSSLLAATILASSPLALPAFSSPAQARELPGSFADLVEKLSPAVVNISTTQKVKVGSGVQFFGIPFDQLPDDPQFAPFREFFERYGQGPQGAPGKKGKGAEAPEREVTSLGSGFIIDPSGYVITNYHVIDSAEGITVTLHNNVKYTAKIVGRDKKTDLALLKINSDKPLPFVPLGDSDKMRVGDWVLAIGNPYGLGGSVSQGIISARQRYINAGPFDDFLQTDAAINRGNSGGPLFNMSGEVVGIASAIFSPSGGNIGIGFAIPTNLAKPVIDQLKQFGRTHRAWLGVKIQEVSDEVADSVGLPKPHGALVVEVTPESPAGKAGVEAGDVITQFDGNPISEMRFLPRMVAESKIGKTVDLTVWRKGKSLTLRAALQELDEKEEEESAKPAKEKPGEKQPGSQTVLGMKLAPVTKDLRQRYRLNEKAAGLLVLEVDPSSEAARRGLSEGDVLSEAGGEKLKTAADFGKAVEAARKAGHKFILVKVLHGEEAAFVTLPAEEKKDAR